MRLRPNFAPGVVLSLALSLGACGLVAVQAQAALATAQCPVDTKIVGILKFQSCLANACETIGGEATTTCSKFYIYERDKRGKLRRTNRASDNPAACFREEYPAAAKRLKERFSTSKWTCRISNVGSKVRNDPPSTAEFALDHGRQKVHVRTKNRGGDARSFFEEVFSTSDFALSPGFRLQRQPGQKNYVLGGLDRDGSDLTNYSKYMTRFGRFAKSNYAIWGEEIADLLTDPEYRLLGATRLTKDGRDLIKVVFEIVDGQGAGNKSRVDAVFDPGAGWILRSFEERFDGSAPGDVQTARIEYGAARDGFFLPSKITMSDLDGDSICDFLAWSFEPTPLSEFEMPFFGLPDLTVRANLKANSVPYYWIGGLAAGGLVIVLVLFFRIAWCRTLPSSQRVSLRVSRRGGLTLIELLARSSPSLL